MKTLTLLTITLFTITSAAHASKLEPAQCPVGSFTTYECMPQTSGKKISALDGKISASVCVSRKNKIILAINQDGEQSLGEAVLDNSSRGVARYTVTEAMDKQTILKIGVGAPSSAATGVLSLSTIAGEKNVARLKCFVTR